MVVFFPFTQEAGNSNFQQFPKWYFTKIESGCHAGRIDTGSTPFLWRTKCFVAKHLEIIFSISLSYEAKVVKFTNNNVTISRASFHLRCFNPSSSSILNLNFFGHFRFGRLFYLSNKQYMLAFDIFNNIILSVLNIPMTFWPEINNET